MLYCIEVHRWLNGWPDSSNLILYEALLPPSQIKVAMEYVQVKLSQL
jgi:hypothetical protein